jgi:allantoinase
MRAPHHREALWQGLQRGALDLIATDHSPAPPGLKCPGDFMNAWGGIASLELSLAAVASASPHIDRSALARWMSERPASLAGLGARKGRIAVGYDADLMVWDPDAEFSVDASTLQQRHKTTPYAGRRLRGRVCTTFLRGEPVWDEGRLACAEGGQLL